MSHGCLAMFTPCRSGYFYPSFLIAHSFVHLRSRFWTLHLGNWLRSVSPGARCTWAFALHLPHILSSSPPLLANREDALFRHFKDVIRQKKYNERRLVSISRPPAPQSNAITIRPRCVRGFLSWPLYPLIFKYRFSYLKQKVFASTRF